MKKILYLLLPLVLGSSVYLVLLTTISQKKLSPENTIIVKLSPDIVSEAKLTHFVNEINQNDLSGILQRFEIISFSSIFKNRYDRQGRLKERESAIPRQLMQGWFELKLKGEFNADDFIARLQKCKGVLQAFAERPMLLKAAAVPNDTNYGNQWHLNNSNNTSFDIDAETAWDINKGRNDVIIAVLDGGVDYNHSDLDPGDRSRIIAGIDTGDDDNDPMDDIQGSDDSYANHGTRIAGVIGARTDNGQQVSGVMWNCKIMPVKMVRNSGGIKIPHIIDWQYNESAFPSDVADALDYAVANGAHVINLSYSFAAAGWMTNEIVLQIPLLLDAIENAYQNNVVITASMGNEYNDDNTIRYPAGFEQVIAVGATNQDGTRRASSNTGSHIDLVAPGTGIVTTSRGGGITTTSGTSFSAPLVAGVAGLVISQAKDRGFNLTNDDVKHIMELTATDISQYGTGFDEQTGHGIVNAHHALQLLAQPNVLYHDVSTGGTPTLVRNYSQWIWANQRWGLAAATYIDVDEYRINKHVNFSTPFCSPPTVWMRERESKTVGWGNPNPGKQFADITNITTSGFDVEYVTYYVRSNVSGQTLNQWIPAAPASTYIAYTAVGQPNTAALVGSVTGPSIVCSSNSTFTLNNIPAGAIVTWQATPANLFAISSGSGVSAQLAAANSSVSGSGSITFTITTSDCGIPVERQATFWVGVPNWPGHLTVTGGSFNDMCVNSQVQVTINEASGATSYSWTSNDPSGLQVEGYGRSAVITGLAPSVYPASDYWTFTYSADNVCGSNSGLYGVIINDCRSNEPQVRVSSDTTKRGKTKKYTIAESDSI